MRTVIVYRNDGTKIEIKPGQVLSRKDFDVENKGLNSERILNAYYQRECEQGSRFTSGYSKNQISRIHRDNIERKQAGF